MSKREDAVPPGGTPPPGTAPQPEPPTLQQVVEVRDACLCLHVQRAARALARHFDEAFRPLGLTNGQFSLMMTLSQPEPPPMTTVAQVLAMDRTTLTAALKPLQRRGLVAVSPAPGDRRSRRPTLTPAGRELLARALPVWRERHAELDRLLAGDPELLRAELRRLSALARECPDLRMP